MACPSCRTAGKVVQNLDEHGPCSTCTEVDDAPFACVDCGASWWDAGVISDVKECRVQYMRMVEGRPYEAPKKAEAVKETTTTTLDDAMPPPAKTWIPGDRLASDLLGYFCLDRFDIERCASKRAHVFSGRCRCGAGFEFEISDDALSQTRAAMLIASIVQGKKRDCCGRRMATIVTFGDEFANPFPRGKW